MPSTDLPNATQTSLYQSPSLSALERGIVQAAIYSDIFDYPLTAAELHRYLIGVEASLDTVISVLSNGRVIPRYLTYQDGYYTLPGRESIIETRRQRESAARDLWPRAVRYGRMIASLPFVRMVAITGELAMDNVRPESDIDYFIVTEPERLWLCRLLTIAFVRTVALRGDVVCPNYFVSERALVIRERNLYTAHEVAQMVPVSGLDMYHRMRQINDWVQEYLPNASSTPRPQNSPNDRGRISSFAEVALRTPPADRLERWEMDRKIRKFTHPGSNQAEAAFTSDWCKGHFDGHGQRTLDVFAKRVQDLEVAVP